MRLLRREDGQALIETAISLTIFTVLTLGAVEFGSMAVSAVEVTNAAKAAAQYAAQSGTTAADRTTMLSLAKNEYHNPTAVTMTSPTSTSGYTCYCSGAPGTVVSCSNNSLTSPTCTNSDLEMMVTVTAQVTYTPIVHVPGLPNSYQMQATAKQKVLQ